MLIFAILASLSITSQAQELDPVPGWQWSGDNNRCGLTQQDPNSRTMLEVGQYPASDQVRMTVADGRLKISEYRSLSATLALEPGASHTGNARLYPETDKLAASVSVEISGDQLLQEFAKTSSVVVSIENMGSVRRPVLSAAAAAHALIQCEDQRLPRWGINPAYWHGLQKHPHPLKPLGGLISEDDYPPGYALNGVSGGVLVRLTVGADGRVKNCVGLNRRVDRYVLQNVCGKMKIAARFEPAVDEQGRKVEAPFIMAESFKVVH